MIRDSTDFLGIKLMNGRLSQVIFLSLLFMITFFCINTWNYIISIKKQGVIIFKKYLIAYIILSIFYLLLLEKSSIWFFVLSFFFITVLIYVEHFKYLPYNANLSGIRNIFILLISATIQFYIVELINGNIDTIAIQYIMGNITIYLVVIWFIYILLRKVSVSVAIAMFFITSFAIANYYVTIFRGSPIVPGDFFALTTATSVMGNYSYEITKEMIFCGGLFLIWICLLYLMEKGTPRISKKNVLSGVYILFFLLISIFSFDIYDLSLDFWNLNNSVKSYGVSMSLIANIRGMGMKKPQGYSLKNLEELYEQYSQQDNENTDCPNIIAIMNESFSDLSVLDKRLKSDMYMPYFNDLDNTIKGSLIVSALGGGTANTEYEFLTGNTMAFIPGSIPYQQYVVKKSYSWVHVLKELDYYTTAIHPFYKNGYNRNKVYPYLGFDKFIGIDDFDNNAELTRNIFISDKASYKRVIKEFEEIKGSGKNAFIFNVTMQNHSAYNTGFFANNTIKIPDIEGNFPETEEYLTLIKESDDAIHILIDYFSKIEDPTVIVFFGDHQPQLSESYYDSIKPQSQWTWDEFQKRYIVPFFIWANFDIPDQNNICTSPNYLSGMVSKIAGIPMTAYQKFLLSLQEEVPVLNINAYLTRQGDWKFYTEEFWKDNPLNYYQYIQYNNIFGKNKIENWFTLK